MYEHTEDVQGRECRARYSQKRLLRVKSSALVTGFVQGLVGGEKSLLPYSKQRPMRTNLSCCLGFIGNGQHKSTDF